MSASNPQEDPSIAALLAAFGVNEADVNAWLPIAKIGYQMYAGFRAVGFEEHQAMYLTSDMLQNMWNQNVPANAATNKENKP